MNITRASLLAAAALAFGMAGAQAQSYPRVVGSGENLSVDYGPMGQGNLVGGGRVMVTPMSGMNVDIVHLDAMFAQQPRDGFVPLTVGSGESQSTVWVPVAVAEMMRNAFRGRAAR